MALRNMRQILKFLVEGKTFDRVLKTTEIVAASPGKCSCEVTVDESHLNRGGGLHGGLTATLVDEISTLAIMSADKPPGVSVDMNISYFNPAYLGDTLVIDAECLKLGKSLAFASVNIRKKEDGSLVAQGRHTKHIAKPFTASQETSK